MGISKITRNYQVTLPRDIRDLKNFRVGDKVLFVIENGKIEMVKRDKDIISNAAGLWKDFKVTGVEYQKELRKTWQKRQ